MGKLTAANRETVELPAVAFTPEQIQQGLETWRVNLAKARKDEDPLAEDTALRFIGCWLDRKLAA